MSDDGNVFFANFLSRHHLSSCLQARAASQSSELSSAADARRRLEEEVSRLRAEKDKALKERKKRMEDGNCAKSDIFSFGGFHISACGESLFRTQVGLL